MTTPYHTIRFHVAYRHEQRDRRSGAVTVYDEPIASPRAEGRAIRIGNKWTARVYVPDTADPWKAAVERAARSFVPVVPFDLPAVVDIDWFFRPPAALEKRCGVGMVPVCVKPDRDNLDKSTLDALVQGRLLYDDSSVAAGTVAKWYTCRDPAIAASPSLLPWCMATADPGTSCDYRTEPGAIIRVRLFKWEAFGLKKPDRYRKPEGIS